MSRSWLGKAVDDRETPAPARRNATLRGGSLALLLGAVLIGWAAPAAAICASSIDRSDVDATIDDPKSLLRLNPRGGDVLVGRIRRLSVNGTQVLRSIGTIIAQANSFQKEAIGQGLARAHGACSARSPEIARQIADLVRTNGDRDVARAFTRFLSSTDDKPSNMGTTSTINPEQRPGRLPRDLESGFAPKALPLGDPFAKR